MIPKRDLLKAGLNIVAQKKITFLDLGEADLEGERGPDSLCIKFWDVLQLLLKKEIL